MVKRKFEEIMKNDSKIEKLEFDSNFFEEASKAWKSNKIEKENCTYEYKCTFRYYAKACNNKSFRCNRSLYEYELLSKNKPLKVNCEYFCKLHINKKYNPEIHTFC